MSDGGPSDRTPAPEDETGGGRENVFLRAVFRGERFNGGRLPLDLMSDLTALNELLKVLARSELAAHTDRKRLPKGYVETTTLWITSISEGSAVLELERQLATLPDDITRDPLESARDLFVETVQAAANQQALPDAFPTKLRSRFNAIGRHLDKGESLELGAPGSTNLAHYTRDVRERLVEKTAGVEDDYFAVGLVHEFNPAKRSFQILTSDGLVDGTYPDELDPDLRQGIYDAELSATYLNGSMPYRVDGTGTFIGDVVKVFAAESVTPVDFSVGDVRFHDAVLRVKECVALPTGWMDDEGEEISPATGEGFLQVLASLADMEQPAPAIFPTLEGCLRAEWEVGDFELVWERETDGSHFVQSRRLGSDEHRAHEIRPGLSAADVAELLSLIMLELQLRGTADYGSE
ncbi:MAG: hypothetical protein ACT452_13400 [Microthrixaceae bacterium]